MKYPEIILIAGALIIGGYFVYQATSQPTSQSSSECAGDWTDYFNPACWFGGLSATLSNEANTATNELNTILIILGLVAVLVVGFLAFGPQTSHIARTAGLVLA